MSVTYECTSVRLGNAAKLKLSSDGGDCSTKRRYGGAYSGVWQSLRLETVSSEEVGSVLVCLAGMWLLVCLAGMWLQSP
jgi:hypothetical protein